MCDSKQHSQEKNGTCDLAADGEGQLSGIEARKAVVKRQAEVTPRFQGSIISNGPGTLYTWQTRRLIDSQHSRNVSLG